MTNQINRRDLLKRAAALGIGLAGLEILPAAALEEMVETAETSAKSKIYLASKDRVSTMVEKVIKGLGGIGKFVKKGAKVVIKPNSAWGRRPEQAANTNPAIIDTIISMCKQAGASSIIVFEHPCDNYSVAFKESGIKAVCDRQGIQMLAAENKGDYKGINIPMAKTMKAAEVNKLMSAADCYINIPIVKVHGGARVTITMKNQMGTVYDMRGFHRQGLHECIADLATVVKPTFCIVDATRMLMTRGPQGPGKVKKEFKVFAGTDMVALDTYGAGLLGVKAQDVPHIKYAYQHGLGQMDGKKIQVVKV